MKIGEVAQRVGVSVSALRLIEAGRSTGGTRHYNEEDVARFHAIVSLTRAEVPIDPLARLARIRSKSPSGAIASRQVEAVLAEIEAEIGLSLASLYRLFTAMNGRTVSVHADGNWKQPLTTPKLSHQPAQPACASRLLS